MKDNPLNMEHSGSKSTRLLICWCCFLSCVCSEVTVSAYVLPSLILHDSWFIFVDTVNMVPWGTSLVPGHRNWEYLEMFYVATIVAVVLDLASWNRKCFPQEESCLEKRFHKLKVNIVEDQFVNLGIDLIIHQLYCLITKDVAKCVSKTTG